MSSPPPPNPRLLAALARSPSPTRAQRSRRWLLIVAASLVPTGSVLLLRGVHLGGRPRGYVALVAAGWCTLIVGASLWTLRPGPTALGRPRPLLALASVGLPLLLLSTSLGASVLFPETWLTPAYGSRVHLACATLATLLAAPPIGALLWLHRRSEPVKPWATGAALGVIAASWAGSIVAVQCPHPEPLHVAVAHVAPIAILALVSAVIASRLLAIRWIDPVP